MKNHVYSPFLYLNKNTYKPIDVVGKGSYNTKYRITYGNAG